MKRRVQKKKESRVIEKYEPLFENMFGSIVQLADEFNPTEYRTKEAQIKSNLEKQFENTNNAEQLGEAFLNLLGTFDFDILTKSLNKKIKKEISEHIKEDERFTELYRLVYDSEKKCPNISSIFFFQSNPIELLSKSFEPFDLIEDFQKLNGEKANRAAVRLFREVAELLYDDYLKAIYGFVQVMEGKKVINLSNGFGNLSNQLPARLKKLGYNNLVDPDAGWLRNATCHGQWLFKPETGKIGLWDLKKKERELTINELAEKAMAMYTMVVKNYLPLIMIYLSNQVCSKEWLAIFKYMQQNLVAIVNGDEKKSDRVNKMIEDSFSNVMKITFKK